ncbi:cytochrome P450 [Streptomyces sp. Z26]|nr:cytochrome P450 [Streptomyces sp. Z26]
MALAERFAWDRRAVDLLARLRDRYDAGVLACSLGGRRVALVLDPEEARRVLEGTPVPFSPATAEKRGALRRFQPHGSLVTEPGELRTVRRRVNEAALQPGAEFHRAAARIQSAVHEELSGLAREASAGRFGRVPATGHDGDGGDGGNGHDGHDGGGSLDWASFEAAWWRAVRRTVFGDTARDDTELITLLARLRGAGNWAGFAPQHRAVRARFLARLRERAAHADPESLAGSLPRQSPDAYGPDAYGPDAVDAYGPDAVDPYGQVAHWLFAFDAAGMAVFRTLAVLGTHPDHRERALHEADRTGAGDAPGPGAGDPPWELGFLRTCVLDTVRLWPTTPLLLRETTHAAPCGDAVLPPGTLVLLHTPYLHRGERAAPYGDRFAPELWRDGGTQAPWPGLVPFSAGPGRCPGRDVVLLASATSLAGLLARHDAAPAPGTLPGPEDPLPATLDHFALRFAVRPR